jgi:hypothetical protein
MMRDEQPVSGYATAGLESFVSDDRFVGDAAKAEPEPMSFAAAPPAPPPPPPPGEPAVSTPEPTAVRSGRAIIYTGSVSLIVGDAEAATTTFIARIEAIGGHLQSRNNTVVTVRIPVEQFKAVVEEVKRVGQVTSENIDSQDVTKQLMDLELRMITAENSHRRLQELLKTATVLADVLAIEAELRRLTEEIEGFKAQLRGLRDLVSMSTLTVAFSANAPGPRPYPQRQQSRFPWVNAVGIEQVMHGF